MLELELVVTDVRVLRWCVRLSWCGVCLGLLKKHAGSLSETLAFLTECVAKKQLKRKLQAKAEAEADAESKVAEPGAASSGAAASGDDKDKASKKQRREKKPKKAKRTAAADSTDGSSSSSESSESEFESELEQLRTAGFCRSKRVRVVTPSRAVLFVCPLFPLCLLFSDACVYVYAYDVCATESRSVARAPRLSGGSGERAERSRRAQSRAPHQTRCEARRLQRHRLCCCLDLCPDRRRRRCHHWQCWSECKE